ncbi:MAG TPA: hypothetical protein VHA52_02975 [Candidatus Babeliaceae bacterium]|nr:hypothetical protein [Candidatus Babeliaceae bacterium]
MKIKITSQIKNSIHSFKNKTSITNAYKIYAALYLKSKYENRDGYFAVPSTYLRSINARYSRFIKKFIEDGILKYYERIEPGFLGIEDRTFKYYDTYKGICMKYKFLVDLNSAEEMEIDFTSEEKSRWYSLIRSSLTQLGYDNIKIKRDGFGLRVWHNAIQGYKRDLKDMELMVIDAKCSQPRLLYNLMKDANIIDTNYFALFENDTRRDFYNFIINQFNLTGIGYDSKRDEAKELFTMWIFGQGYTKGFQFHQIFPEASSFIRALKNRGYKDSASYMQRQEAKVWIDDIMENIPIDFAIPVHDSIIVRANDAGLALDWCKEKHPEIVFTLKEL